MPLHKRADIPTKDPVKPSVLAASAGALLALTIGSLITLLMENRLVAEAHQSAQEAATQMVGRIDRQLTHDLSVTQTLAAFVKQGHGSVANFETVARDLLSAQPGVGALELAPDGVIRQIVPLTGNQPAIGHDVLADLKRSTEAHLALETRQLTLAGPLTLLQGGEAVIGRLPIFLADRQGREQFWGFTIAVLRLPEFLSTVGIRRLEELGYAFELKRQHPDSGQAQVFAASKRPLGPDPERVVLNVPNGHWFLDVAPVRGWYSPERLALETVGILFLALVCGTIAHRLSESQQSVLRESIKNQAVLRAASDGIHVLDEHGDLQEVSDSFCAMLGYSRDELIGSNVAQWDAFFSPQKLRHLVQLQFAQPGHTLFESRHRRKDGSFFDVEVTGYPFELDGKRLLFNSARDITARKEAEAEQHRLNRNLRLLNESNTALLHVDQESRLLPEICRLVVETGGYLMAWVGFAEADEDKTVRPVAHFGLDESYLGDIKTCWSDTALGRGPTGTAIRTGTTQVNNDTAGNPTLAPWRQAADRLGHRSSIALPLVSNGTVLGALNIYAIELAAFGPEEVALLERLANNLAFGIDRLRAKQQLAAAHKELQGFTYAASHDLRAPLGRINSFAGLLERDYRDRLEGNGLMFLDLIQRNATRMTALIEDLLAHTEIEHQIHGLQTIGLPEAVQSVLLERSDDIRESGAQVRLDLPELSVFAHPHGLAQVLHNLLENALKYSASAQPPRIEISAREQDGYCRLWLRDNGIGFDMAYHDRIFEIFRRLHTYEEFPGSGVGLALVKKAMERMGGKVWARSTPGQGATFYLEMATEAAQLESSARMAA